MTAAIPLFISGAADKLAALAMKCLAVGGGFLAGYVSGGVVAWALDRWVFAHKAPDFVKKSVAMVCGVGGAIIVALIVFGDGSGGGLFGGGGPADGTGPGTSPDATKTDKPTTAPTPKTPPPKADPVKAADVEPGAPQVRVTFLGGDAVPAGDRRFYLIDGDPDRKAFDDVKAAVEAKKKDAGPRQVLLVVQYPSDLKLAADERSRTVTQVTDWAEAGGVRVVLGQGK